MTVAPVTVAIALGSNMADRYELLRSARESIGLLDGVTILATSQVEETPAFGPPQPAYLNQMMLVNTTQSLAALLSDLQLIEREHGRSRALSKGPRTLDLDIVWARHLTITTRDLLVPHPGLGTREFWQRELTELLGVDEAADAVDTALVHAGMDTEHSASAPDGYRWSGSWETFS